MDKVKLVHRWLLIVVTQFDDFIWFGLSMEQVVAGPG